jgi:hypothetical protein
MILPNIKRWIMYRALMVVAAMMGLVVAAGIGGAATLPVSGYSQNDPAYKNDRMGNGGTIGQQGCLMTCVANALRTSPRVLNAWLNANGGYANGGVLNHNAAAAFDGPGGLQFVGFGQLPWNAAGVNNGIAAGTVYIVRSTRGPQHWVLVFTSNGQQSWYSDPWDGTCRPVGDAWVSYGNQAIVYKVGN